MCQLLPVMGAAARALRHENTITVPSLIGNKHSHRLSAPEISAVVEDFARREVLRERDGKGAYEFVLPLFGLWLKDVGIIRLGSDALAEELAEAVQIEEDKAYVKAEEVSSLAKTWRTYRGKEIGADDIRAWLEQVPSHIDQRLLFTILKNLKVFTEAEVRDKLQFSFDHFVRPHLPDKIVFAPQRVQTQQVRGRSVRSRSLARSQARGLRADVVITYVDGEGKSGQHYASRFVEENQIPTRCIIPPVKFTPLLESYISRHGAVAATVIIDDIVATGGTLVKKLASFVRENEGKLRELGSPLFAIVLAGTDEGTFRVREAMAEFDWLNFHLRVCEPLMPQFFAFEPDNRIWGNQDEFERAKSLCRDLGVNIYPDDPFGYGDQGLLIVFPDACPNNTLPIIHSAARADAAREWLPLFARPTN